VPGARNVILVVLVVLNVAAEFISFSRTSSGTSSARRSTTPAVR
jgi:hypothetical protein